MIKKLKKNILQLLIAIALVYLAVVISIYFYQRKLLYHPNENNYFGDKLAVDVENVKIQTSDGLSLNGWFHEKDLQNLKTLVFFHGNAGTLDNRIYKLNHFKDIDINFLIIAWRGFSGNEGKPTEEGLYIDGRSAVNWIINKGAKEENIILYGESLGTGIATEIAQNKNFGGLILETPFTSMVAAAKNFYPYLPVSILLKDRYENDKKIENIKMPIMVLHGKKDTIVPFAMGQKIFEISKEPKYSYFTEYDNHMMEYDEQLITALKRFFTSLN